MLKSAIPRRPNQPDPTEPDDLFRARLSQQIDRRYSVVRLAGLIDGEVFEARSGPLYTRRPAGRGALSGALNG